MRLFLGVFRLIVMVKKLISFSLIIGSVVFAFLIMNANPVSITLEGKINDSSLIEESENYLKTPDLAAEENSTEELVKKIAEELVNLNPNGPFTSENQQWINVEKPEDLINRVLSEELASFNPATLRASVDASIFNVSHDSAEGGKDYAQSFQATVIEVLSNINSGRELEIEKIPKIVTAYNELAKKLGNLPVPANLVAVHKKGVELLLTQRNILQKISEIDSDPAAAIIAIHLMPVVEKEIEDFNGELMKLNS